MELTFDVGTEEPHHVQFRFNKFWGGLSITVDGQQLVSEIRMFSVQLVKTGQFSVGTREKHEVRIEKTRALLAAGFRPQPVVAYVDDQPVARGVA